MHNGLKYELLSHFHAEIFILSIVLSQHCHVVRENVIVDHQ